MIPSLLLPGGMGEAVFSLLTGTSFAASFVDFGIGHTARQATR